MWKTLVGIILGLVVIFFAADLIFFRKTEFRSKYRNQLINILLILGALLEGYVVIKNMTLVIFLQILLLNSVDLCVLILATTGIVLIFKTSVTANFAQGMIATFGAFFAAKVVMYLGDTYIGMSMMSTLILGIIGGILISFLIGLFIDTVIIRYSKRVTAVGKQMITMGLVLVLVGAMPVIFGTLPISMQAFSYDVKIIKFGSDILALPNQNYIAIIITVIVLSILFLALRLTKWGLGVRATASNEIVASMMGVNTRVITALSWAIAGGLAGLAACLFAPQSSQITLAYMVPTQINAFLAPVMGGFFSFGGSIVGAILINIFTSVASFFNSVWANVIVYSLILLIVLIKPFGLFNKKIDKKV